LATSFFYLTNKETANAVKSGAMMSICT